MTLVLVEAGRNTNIVVSIRGGPAGISLSCIPRRWLSILSVGVTLWGSNGEAQAVFGEGSC